MTKAPMMNAASRISRLGLLLLFAPCVHAHDNLPANWCLDPSTAPVASTRFSFTPEMLERYQRANPELRVPAEDCDTSANRSCGIVDEWHYANEMAMAFCAGSENSVSRSAASFQGPLVVVSSPEDFNTREHHDLYRFRDGNLIGTCIVCAPKPQAPVPNEPPTK